MLVVSVHQAKTNLFRLIEEAVQREEIIIVRGSKAVARLVAIGKMSRKRRAGSMKGRLVVRPQFFEPSGKGIARLGLV